MVELCKERSSFIPITEVKITNGFSCSTSEVLNSVIDAISRTIDEEEGVKSFEIDSFADQNFLESWSLSQIVTKSMYCEYLKVAFLGATTPNNRSRMLEFVGQMSV